MLVDKLDLSDVDRFKAAPLVFPLVKSASSADIRVGLSVGARTFDFDDDDPPLDEVALSAAGKSIVALVGVVGPEPVTSVMSVE